MAARNELLPIDTSFKFKVNDELSDGEKNFDGVLNTSARLSTAVSIPDATSSFHRTVRPSTNIHARNEARKLVSHVLLQLANRRKPPPVLDALVYTTQIREESSFGVLPPSMKEVKGVKPETKSEGIPLAPEDISEDEQLSFSTDDTINLVVQLEDVLATSIAQGWQIFDERSVTKLPANEAH